MYKKICITNRHLVQGDFLMQLENVMHAEADAVILREKDLTQEAYSLLAEKVQRICAGAHKEFICHTCSEVAMQLQADGLHLSAADFRRLPSDWKERNMKTGVSVHSAAEAEEMQAKGADYVIVSNIFPTDCKPGLPGKGTELIRETKALLDIPVYALGGITDEDAVRSCIEAGADGICMMSGYMKNAF